MKVFGHFLVSSKFAETMKFLTLQKGRRLPRPTWAYEMPIIAASHREAIKMLVCH